MKLRTNFIFSLFVIVVIGLVGCKSLEGNWKPYQNDMFSIEYPPHWQLTEDGSKGINLDGEAEGNIIVRYFWDDLNFGDSTTEYPKRVKMNLDQFMDVAKQNDAFQNIRKTEFNGYNAYEIDFRTKVSYDDGKTYQEEISFLVMTENSKGHVYQIRFDNRPTKKDLTSTELKILSTFKFK